MQTTETPTYLATKHPHPRDAFIHFDEGPHKYTIEGINGITAETEFTSVTTFVHGHFEHFDAKQVIAAMMRNEKKWNDPIANAKYYGKTPEEIEEMWNKAGRDAAAKGTEMHYNIECFYNDTAAIDATDATAATDNNSRRGGADTPENEMERSCDASHTSFGESRTVSRRGGADTPEFKYFLNFHNEHVAIPEATLRPYRTEWTVFHEEARIAGSIDMVYEVVTPDTRRRGAEPPADTPADTPTEPIPIDSAVNSYLRSNPTATPHNPSNVVPSQGGGTPRSPSQGGGTPGGTPLAIYDWKRCREIVKTNRGNKFATHRAIEHLPDTNYWHYALQLNIYKYILQTKYDKTVTDLYLVVLHPEAQNYQRVKLPDLQAEVAELFEERISINTSRPL